MLQDAETTYFNESHQAAKDAVSQTLEMYERVLAKMDEAEKGKLQRSMGLKMEQLKACTLPANPLCIPNSTSLPSCAMARNRLCQRLSILIHRHYVAEALGQTQWLKQAFMFSLQAELGLLDTIHT